MSTIHAPPVTTFTLDRTRHAAPQVFEHLRELIVAMALAPGTVLSRAELAQQYNVSQTPVRDALIRLSEEGLVDIYPQHATLVSRIDLSLAHEAHFLRLSVEMEIARTLAAHADPALSEQLRLIVMRQKTALLENDLSTFMQNDHTFHRTMYDAARVPHLHALIRRQSGHLDRLRRLHLPAPGKATAIIDDHEAIVGAIATGDVRGAEQSVRAHLSDTLAHVKDIRLKYGDYLKV